MDVAIISFYRGINNRGVERWVNDLTGNLSGKCDFTIYQNSNLPACRGVEIVNGYVTYQRKIVKSKLLKRFFIDYDSLKILHFCFKILPKLIFRKHQIIIPTDGGWESAIVRIICWLTGKKMIIVGHAGVGYDDLNNLWCFPDCFVALSKYALMWARKANPFVKLTQIPNGVDTNLFVPFTKPKNGRNVLCVGALTKDKRIDLVINAVAKIPDLNLTIVGEGEEESYLKNLAFEKLGKRASFLRVSFDEIPKLYQNSDLLISASTKHFSFEMVLIEAMACNLAVIANDDPIRREIVGNAGFLVDPTKENEFIRLIRKALSTNWKDVPRKRAEMYSWNKIAGKYYELFESISM
ncbi:MAG: glycosyltransferase [Patescibacteria group bacterium]|nr:glycosyltransferase [Patescibacteria group bacterium]